MKIKRSTLLWFAQVSLMAAFIILVMDSCGANEKICCSQKGGITLDFSSLPAGPLPPVFTVNQVTGIRIYDRVKRVGASLRLLDEEDVPPGGGNKKDAAVMLLFSLLPCHVCVITSEVHGHGSEARMVATQQDGATQTALCPGDKKVLTLNATRDNPFIWVILSGQEAEWLNFRVQ